MAKNRVIYQTEVVYAGNAPATGEQYNSTQKAPNIKPLVRVQSANYSYNLTRRDVNQFGELAAIDRILLESPTVNFDFSYLNNTLYNEKTLGFYVNSGQGYSSAITNILNKTEDDRNYFIKTVSEGVDAHDFGGSGTAAQFVSIGNGFISNFSTEASVGDFPRTTVSVEGLNMLFQQAKSGDAFFPTWNVNSGNIVDSPAVNPVDGTRVTGFALVPMSRSSAQAYSNYTGFAPVGTSPQVYSVSALRPGDVTLDFWTAGTTTDLNEAGALISDMKIQSYNLNFSLTRDPLQKLGSKYAFAREIRFPVQVNLSVEANLGDIKTGNLVDVITTDSSYDVRIGIKHPQSGNVRMIEYTLKNAKLDSQSYSSSIGPNKTVSLNFSSQVGGPLQTTRGLFFSGIIADFGEL